MKEITKDSYSKFLGVSKLRSIFRFQGESSGRTISDALLKEEYIFRIAEKRNFCRRNSE